MVLQSEAKVIFSIRQLIEAWAVHAYTSVGLVLGFTALWAAANEYAGLFILYLTLAAIVDATDGTLARWFKVKERLPDFDGRKLDDITDYLNYVFIPVFACYHFNLVHGNWTWVLAFVLVAAAYGFSHQAAKTEDGFFTGFPNYWNVVALYLLLLGMPVWANAVILLVLAVLVFVPLRYLSTRTRQFGSWTVGLGLIWGAMIVAILLQWPSPNKWLVWLSLFYPAYYLAMSFFLSIRCRRVNT
mgnify:CR=1 FL=1